ncbi:family 20 glycosylhydrolase [Kiritimatiellota bacterium B12222]|nr:family 20 glycosylhydrolase [Kiritimatiellota bacterium B12222]
MPSPRFIPTPKGWHAKPEQWTSPENFDQQAFSERCSIEASLHPEGYKIEVSPEGVAILLGSARAEPYAWQHFEQWMELNPLPCGCLEDEPSFPRRGFMLDVSRCKIPTRESLQAWVNLLARFRYNELQLYTEHSFAYTAHQTVWADSSPLNKDDILWLKSICTDAGIELVPNQNCFGHFERWLKHKAYEKYAECPNGFITPWGERRDQGAVLKPDAASFEFITGLLDEYLPLFESDWVNIGCDETWELGQGASQGRCEQEGLSHVYTEFVAKIMQYVQDVHGRRCQFWGDIIIKTPEELKNLPREAMALEWGYDADHPFEAETTCFKNSGLDFMVCPGTSSWLSFTGRTQNMRENIQKAAQAAHKNGALGLLLTDWGDWGHLQQSPVSFPGIAWCGLHAWHPETATWQDMIHWCDQQAFDQHAGDCQSWLDLGEISDLLHIETNNSNAIFEILKHPDKTTGKTTAKHFQACLDALRELKAPSTFSDEWTQTIRNVSLCLQTALHLKGCDQKDLPQLYKETLSGHQKLWRQRNREGGLAESLSRYTEVGNKLNLGEKS